MLLYLAAVNSPIEGLTHGASVGARDGGILGPLDWIDRAVGTKPRVSALWTGSPDVNFVSLWDNEFFNRSVGPVYNIHGPPDGLPQETLTFDYATSQYRHANGKPVPVEYLLTDHSEIPVGTPVASDGGTGMVLYRVDGPLQISYETAGIYRDALVRRNRKLHHLQLPRRPAEARAAGRSRDQPAPAAHRRTRRRSGRLLARTSARPSHLVRFVVPVPDGKRTCRIGFTVTPTAVPAETIHTGDTRELGIRMLRPVYSPS